MPRKPAAKAAPAKKSYADMMAEAITAINSRKGCSQIALENYIVTNYKKLDFKRHLLRSAVKRGIASGRFLVHHNHKNSIKLPAKSKAPAKKPAAKKPPAKKPAPKKRPAKKVTKKKPTKKAPAKKTTKKKAPRRKLLGGVFKAAATLLSKKKK